MGIIANYLLQPLQSVMHAFQGNDQSSQSLQDQQKIAQMSPAQQHAYAQQMWQQNYRSTQRVQAPQQSPYEAALHGVMQMLPGAAGMNVASQALSQANQVAQQGAN